jgi:peptidoglycan/xylan/chitin deacetylase (PgdA/CDA1 family)
MGDAVPQGSERVFNICFHGIGRPDRRLEPGEDRYWITADTYRSVLDLLVGRRDVRISFDDGNASDLQLGLDPLLERGLDATFFVLAGRLDRPGSLSSADLQVLVGHGMGVGTHGMDHCSWRGMDPRTRTRELVTAREAISEVAGTPVTEAAIPRGEYDRGTLRQLREHDYAAVHTSDRRPARRGAWVQPRFSVRADDTVTTIREHVLVPPSLPRHAVTALKSLAKRWR